MGLHATIFTPPSDTMGTLDAAGEYTFLRFPPGAVRVDGARLRSLPASARLVFDAILVSGPLTNGALRVETGLPPRTLRFAVRRLKDAGLVQSRGSLRDGRNTYVCIAKDCVGPEALEEARRRADEAALAGRVIEHV